MPGIDEVDDAHIRLTRMFPMQATCILLEGALPGNRHGQHQGIQRRMIESLTDQFSSGQDHPGCIGRQRFQFTD